MTGRRLLSKLLKFKGFRALGFWWESRGRDLVVAVKPHKNGARCPECGHRGKIVRTLAPRRWRDGRICGQTVWLSYGPREIRCRTHGQVVEVIPWAAPFSRVTYRFEYTMLRLCQSTTQKVVADLLGIPTSTLSDLLHRAIERGREGHKIRGLRTIGIDKIHTPKNTSMRRSSMIWIGPVWSGSAPEKAERPSTGSLPRR